MVVRNILFFLLLICPLTLTAQDVGKHELLAEHIFSLLLHNQTDSLYALLAEIIKAQLPREQLEGGLTRVEQMAGPYQRHGEWKHETSAHGDVWSSTLEFEQGQFSFVVVIDANGCIQGLRIMPNMNKQAVKDIPLPPDAVEVDDTVRTGTEIALPCSVVISGRSTSPPIVVMVHGSGALDRNETVMANAPFLDLSRQLAEQGISSLRYDKRTAVYPETVSTMDDETILDALSAISLARTYSNNVFLLGHSLGAMLAPEIATRTNLQGIIMMAAPARDLSEVIDEQLSYLVPADSAESIKQTTIEQLRQQSPHYLQPQHQVETAQSLSLPMLIMQGGRDYQVTMRDFDLWRDALKEHPRVLFADYPALNHLFLPGEGKSSPQEYATPGTIPAEVTDAIAKFITSQQ